MSQPTSDEVLAAFREATGWSDALALHYATCMRCMAICGHEEFTCDEAPRDGS